MAFIHAPEILSVPRPTMSGTGTVTGTGQAFDYWGVPYVTDPVPSAIMPTLPTGADFDDHEWTTYDPATIEAPSTGDVADWDNAPNHYYVAYNGNNGTAGNSGNGNPTNPRATLPTGSLSAGTVIFVEGEGIALPVDENDVNRNFHEIEGWLTNIATFNSAGTFTNSDDICWVVGINNPRVQSADAELTNCNHVIFDGIILDDGDGDSRGGRIRWDNCHYCTFRNGAQYGPSNGTSNDVGGVAYGITDCTFNLYYNNECAYFGAWLVQDDPDFHAWRPTWGNRWLWCVDNEIHHLKGDSTQIGNSSNTQVISQNTHYAYFAGNECYTNQENAVDCKNSSHIIVSENLCYDFTGAGGGGANSTAIVLSQDGEGFHSHHHWAFGNTVRDSGTGIRCSGNNEIAEVQGGTEVANTDGFIQADRDYVIGNLIYDTTVGLAASHGSYAPNPGAQHHYINNTVVNATTGININMFQGSTALYDNYVDGNVFYECGTEIAVSGDGALRDYITTDNVLYKAAGGETIEGSPDTSSGNVTGSDPLFTDAGNDDYTLSSDSSPAHEATDENAAYQIFEDMYGIDIRRDHAGNARPSSGSWDAGAFQRG